MPDINPDNNALSGITVAKSVTAASVVKAYLDAIGGEDKLRSVKDLTVSMADTLQATVFSKVNRYKMPDKFLQEVSRAGTLTSHIAINGDSLFLVQGGKSQRLFAEAAGKARYHLFPELDFSQAGYAMELDDQYHIIDGAPAYLVTVSQPGGIRVKYFYDQKTGLKVLQYVDAPNVTHLAFSDYRTIAPGVKIPFSQSDIRGADTITYTVVNAAANTRLPDTIFK